MQRLNERMEPNGPALVMANPGTREERIYLIKNVYITSSGAWFHFNERLSRGTHIQVTFRLKYGLDQKPLRVTYSGKVVQTGFMGFAVEFDL